MPLAPRRSCRLGAFLGYNAAIEACQVGGWEVALWLLDDMRHSGLQPPPNSGLAATRLTTVPRPCGGAPRRRRRQTLGRGAPPAAARGRRGVRHLGAGRLRCAGDVAKGAGAAGLDGGAGRGGRHRRRERRGQRLRPGRPLGERLAPLRGLSLTALGLACGAGVLPPLHPSGPRPGQRRAQWHPAGAALELCRGPLGPRLGALTSMSWTLLS